MKLKTWCGRSQQAHKSTPTSCTVPYPNCVPCAVQYCCSSDQEIHPESGPGLVTCFGQDDIDNITYARTGKMLCMGPAFPAAERSMTSNPRQAQGGFLGMRDYVDRCPSHLSCSIGSHLELSSPRQVSLIWKICLTDQQNH